MKQLTAFLFFLFVFVGCTGTSDPISVLTPEYKLHVASYKYISFIDSLSIVFVAYPGQADPPTVSVNTEFAISAWIQRSDCVDGIIRFKTPSNLSTIVLTARWERVTRTVTFPAATSDTIFTIRGITSSD